MTELNKPNEELVPKTELDKVKTEAQQSVELLQKQVNDAKMQLLSTEYLSFLEEKKKPKGKEKNEGESKESEEVKELKAELAQMRAQQADLAAHMELDQVMKAHPDFETFRADVQKVLETSRTDLTIEQAYLIAKGGKEPVPGKKEEKKSDFSSEKPGGVYPPKGAETEKKFKSEHDAGMDAANTVLAKYGISGGTI